MAEEGSLFYENSGLVSPNAYANGTELESIFVSKLVLGCCIVTFVENVLGALVAPFFAEHATKRFSASTSTIGLTISAFPFVNMIASPVCGLLCDRVGRLKMMYVGLLIMSASLLVFGEANSMLVCVLSRVFHGIGSACINVGMYAILARRVASTGTNIGPGLEKAMGAVEATGGCGDMAGPALGGLLFHLLPWRAVCPLLAAAAGALALALPPLLGSNDDKYSSRDQCQIASPGVDGPRSLVQLPKLSTKAYVQQAFTGESLLHPKKKMSMLDVMDPTAVLLLGTTALVVLANRFSDATLTQHFSAVAGGGALRAGLLYAVPSLAYPLVAAMVPKLTRSWGAKAAVTVGLLFMGTSNLLLGPAPPLHGLLIPVNPSGVAGRGAVFLLLIIALACWGVGMALGLVPLLPLLQSSRDESDHMGKDMIASFYNAAWSAGEMLGPVAGGFLSETLPRTTLLTCIDGNGHIVSGFPWASALCGGVLVIFSGFFQSSSLVPSSRKSQLSSIVPPPLVTPMQDCTNNKKVSLTKIQKSTGNSSRETVRHGKKNSIMINHIGNKSGSNHRYDPITAVRRAVLQVTKYSYSYVKNNGSSVSKSDFRQEEVCDVVSEKAKNNVGNDNGSYSE